MKTEFANLSEMEGNQEVEKVKFLNGAELHLWKVIQDALKPVIRETTDAINNHPKFNSAHEAYGVLLEEVDELWDECKRDNIEFARKEAVQVACVALRFLIDIHPKPHMKDES